MKFLTVILHHVRVLYVQFHQNRMSGIRASQKGKDLSRLFYRTCVSFFWGFLWKKNIFRALRVTSFILLWSCGTDECIRINCWKKDLRYFSALCDFSKYSVKAPLHFRKCFRLEKAFCEPKVPRSVLWDSIPVIKTFEEKYFPKLGLLVFLIGQKEVIESYVYPSGYLSAL